MQGRAVRRDPKQLCKLTGRSPEYDFLVRETQVNGWRGKSSILTDNTYQLTDGQDPSTNQWNQVDDFNWLKAEASPNWSTLSAQDDGWIEPRFWETTVRGGPSLSTHDILREAGVVT